MWLLSQAHVLTHPEKAIYPESHLPSFVWALSMHLYNMLMFTVFMIDICNSFVLVMLYVHVLSVLPAVIVKVLSWLDI